MQPYIQSHSYSDRVASLFLWLVAFATLISGGACTQDVTNNSSESNGSFDKGENNVEELSALNYAKAAIAKFREVIERPNRVTATVRDLTRDGEVITTEITAADRKLLLGFIDKYKEVRKYPKNTSPTVSKPVVELVVYDTNTSTILCTIDITVDCCYVEYEQEIQKIILAGQDAFYTSMLQRVAAEATEDTKSSVNEQ